MLRRVLLFALAPVKDLGAIERLVLLGVVVLHVVGIGWGLPASDGWDVDGIAPRDFLPGVIQTFTPGAYFTYPPLHLTLLSVLTLPVTLVALAKAPTLTQADVIATFLSVPVMTLFAYTARIVNALMSVGIVLTMGKTAAAIFGTRARVWAIAIAGVEIAGTYYGHTSNLDVPALFWASLALHTLVVALKDDEPRRLRRVAVLAACAIASKDQAYAIFALSLPAACAAWGWVRARQAREGRGGGARVVMRESAIAAVLGVGLVLLIDGALLNPSGFAARLRFLTGHASQDYAVYPRDWGGRVQALKDAVTFLPHHYPLAFAPIFVLGMVAAGARARGRERVAAIVPLLGMISFTLAFNCVARRVEERFMLPQMQLVAVYGGGAVAAVLERATGRASQWMIRLGAAACVLSGLRLSMSLVGTMLGDSRYDAERFLAERIAPGDVVEVYGNNVYLPRFPTTAKIVRVGSTSPAARNPMPGIVEVEARMGAIEERKPRWVVVSTCFAWRFLQHEQDVAQGHMMPEAQRTLLADDDATSHIRALWAERGGYRIARVSHYAGTPLFPPWPIHASLSCDVYTFERRAP